MILSAVWVVISTRSPESRNPDALQRIFRRTDSMNKHSTENDPQKGPKKTPPIKVKEDPKATILKHASDDVLALAIRDMMKKK
jgi:hypothetical protein